MDQFVINKPSPNIIGNFTLSFHNQHNRRELKHLLQDLDIEINQVILEGGSVQDLHNLLKAWFNLLLYYEVGLMTTIYLKIVFGMPYVFMTPMGVVDIAECIQQIQRHVNKLAFVSLDRPINYESYIN